KRGGGGGQSRRVGARKAAAAAAAAAKVEEGEEMEGVTLEELRKKMADFAKERDWEPFHSPRNLLLALVGEVGELSEIFQWKGEVPRGLPGWKEEEKEHVGEELSDVLLYLVQLSDICGIDLGRAALRKVELNAIKYPVSRCKGSSKKHTHYNTSASGAAGDSTGGGNAASTAAAALVEANGNSSDGERNHADPDALATPMEKFADLLGLIWVGVAGVVFSMAGRGTILGGVGEVNWTGQEGAGDRGGETEEGRGQRKGRRQRPHRGRGQEEGMETVTLEDLRKKMEDFAKERDWDKFHSPRNLLLALVGEVGELSEIFQWKGEVPKGLPGWEEEEKQHLGEELSDVLLYLVRLSDICGIDLGRAALRKVELNAIKYPASRCKGSSRKHTHYDANASGSGVDAGGIDAVSVAGGISEDGKNNSDRGGKKHTDSNGF
ncbi:hypothetical protein Taro_027332, partial [Colocasia esculenta]|nr:hypothetical protein [Colocasia esculenta]